MPQTKQPSSSQKRMAAQKPMPKVKRQRAEPSSTSADECDVGNNETASPLQTQDETSQETPQMVAQREKLLRAIRDTGTIARIYIEITPASPARNGSDCKLTTCSDKIQQGDYRIALTSHARPSASRRITAELYHVKCFEKVADLTNREFLRLVTPMTRTTFRSRGVNPMSIMEGNYILDAAAERLVIEWHSFKMDGKKTRQINGILNDLLYKAGSPGFVPKKPAFMSTTEFDLHARDMAAIESDGIGDTNEWNLFQTYMPHGYAEDPDLLKAKHSLSNILDQWVRDSTIVQSAEESLSEDQKAIKDALSPKAIRAIKRLSTFYPPTLSM